MKHGTINLPQGQVAYIANDFKQGRPNVLALHGWLDNAASFSPLMSFLNDYNVFAIDLPGHGHSFHRPEFAHYHFIDWVSDLSSIADKLFPQQKFALLGHSLGGMLSTVFAAMYPERIENLVLIDAAGLVTQNEEGAVLEMRKALKSRESLMSKTKRVHPNFQSAVDARFSAGDLSKAACELLVERNTQNTSQGIEWRTDQRLRTGSPVRINHQTAQQIVSSIEAPTMIILAKNGYDMVKQNFLKFQKHYLNLEHATVEGGHHCHMDDPQATATIIKRFI